MNDDDFIEMSYEFDKMCFQDKVIDADKVKQFMKHNNIDINDINFMRNLYTSKKGCELFFSLVDDFDLSIDDYSIIKYVAHAGNNDDADYLLSKVNMSKSDFKKICSDYIILCNKQYFENI